MLPWEYISRIFEVKASIEKVNIFMPLSLNLLILLKRTHTHFRDEVASYGIKFTQFSRYIDYATS
jgi:hypothetical protein